MSEDANDTGAVVTSSSINSSPEARFAELVITCNNSRIRIAELEATVASLEKALSETQRTDSHTGAPLGRKTSAPLLDQPFKKSGLQEISEWNKELVATVDELRASILKMETDAKVQIIVLGDEVERLRTENASLQRENDALKERVADDVLRQRQANRVEMAFEKAKIAGRVRTAGLRRLECMEAVLMETHDDLYFVQRFDAMKLPVRDVTFVIHIVANVSHPLVGGEEFTMNIYQGMLLSAARECRGYHVCSVKQMEVFAFHSATAALHFTKECHVGVTNVAWPARTAEIPYFAPVIDNGEVLYSGPRIHTCVYTCNPGSEVDPITGRPVYYGQEVRNALITALQAAPVGEIVANEAWGKLYCKEVNIMNDIHTEISTDVQNLRDKLGTGWSVLSVDPPYGDLLYSMIPVSLERRRGLPPYLLNPTPRFPRALIDTDMFLSLVINPMKGVKQLAHTGVDQQKQLQKEGWIECICDIEKQSKKEKDFHSSDLVELYSLRRERENIITLYKKLETVCAFQEKIVMESEDAYLARIHYIDPSETSYVCTVDIGDSALWREITSLLMSEDEHRSLRDLLMSAVLLSGSKNEGIQVNGNNRDVFTFAFRRPEHVLRFISEVYSFISEKCETLGKGERCLMRAAITAGRLRPVDSNVSQTAAFRSHHNDNNGDSDNGNGGNKIASSGNFDDSTTVLICRGRVVTLSGTLCDLAREGEILAVSEVVQDYYATKTNLASMEYNIVKRGGRYIPSISTLIDVYSILPKSYAYRQRQQRSMSSNGESRVILNDLPHRSAKAELQLEGSTLRREEVIQLLSQQQELMERGEAAMMASHDTAWDLTAQQSLRLPWLLMSDPTTTTTTTTTDMANSSDIGFLFCDAARVSSLSRLLQDELCKDVLAQYNHVVKQALLEHDGFVARTDSRTAYIAFFRTPHQALEAALQMHRQLLALDWPRRLHTLDPTLRVRSARTGRMLFAGVRLRAAVGVSRWIYAVGAAGRLGGRAGGGEIVLTPAAIAAIGATLHGSLLLQQLAVRVVDDQTDKNNTEEAGPILACVPRVLGERLELIATQQPNGQSENGEGKVSWWQEASTGAEPLPTSRMIIQRKTQAAVEPSAALVSPAILQLLDDVVRDFKKELAVSIDAGPSREQFLILSRDLLNAFCNAIRTLEEGLSRTAPTATIVNTAETTPTATPTTTTPTPPTVVTTTNTTAAGATTTTATQLKENSGNTYARNTNSGSGSTLLQRMSKNRLMSSIIPRTNTPDPYKSALQLLDNAIKSAVQRSGRTLPSGVHPSILPKLRALSKLPPDRGHKSSIKVNRLSGNTRM
ncbi:hypothetical protein LSM04_001863 [Trypanosoma melophagium]|uniref:uncharacterized protein n=1 Tax=Trypanosoma melophagium TaxID=715481 RepID=UPI00351A45B3|nr:hypothetical protein LSM04_001863 [Trypanosoma melophagium]